MFICYYLSIGNRAVIFGNFYSNFLIPFSANRIVFSLFLSCVFNDETMMFLSYIIGNPVDIALIPCVMLIGIASQSGDLLSKSNEENNTFSPPFFLYSVNNLIASSTDTIYICKPLTFLLTLSKK